MNCPKCQTPMREREREAGDELVIMDVCPSCGGIWLDKGELEKLTRVEARTFAGRGYGNDDDDDDQGGGGHGGSRSGHGQQRRGRGGFLGGLFGDD